MGEWMDEEVPALRFHAAIGDLHVLLVLRHLLLCILCLLTSVVLKRGRKLHLVLRLFCTFSLGLFFLAWPRPFSPNEEKS